MKKASPRSNGNCSIKVLTNPTFSLRLQTAERLSETKKDIRNREETFQYCIAISAKFKCELLSYFAMSNQF